MVNLKLQLEMSKKKILTAETTLKIRFSEVDSMGVVWHGSYVKYLEDAREAFGAQHGLSYLFVFDNGFFTPLVSLDILYKAPLVYGDEVTVKAIFIETEAAKIIFEYEVINAKTGKLCATAKSVQTFLNKEYELELYAPEFYLNWKKEHLK
jgi:acyl-CoA thioester hydrolase